MKIKRFIITGILLSLIGAGICTIAATRDDFDIHNMYVDPTIEEKRIELQEIEKITYDGTADYVIVKQTEDVNSLVYYEGKHLSYAIEYHEEDKELIIRQEYTSSFFNFSALSKGNKPVILNINGPLDSLDFHLNAGKLSTENLTIKKGSIELNAGDIELNNSKIDVLDLEINAGDIRFQGDILTQAIISINAGYLKMNLDRSSNTYKINGKGSGEVLIIYNIDAGSSSFKYKE